MSLTHEELVQRAARWLRNTKRCGVVLTERATGSFEIPDAIGWKGSGSTLVECKVSRADFQRDQRKAFRQFPRFAMGNYRYYMTLPGLLDPDEMPENWGLLEVHGSKVRVIREAERFNGYEIAFRELPMLYSELRRIQGLKPQRARVEVI